MHVPRHSRHSVGMWGNYRSYVHVRSTPKTSASSRRVKRRRHLPRQKNLKAIDYLGKTTFMGARECYTRGLQIAGAVDPVVMSQLYNNRATANLRLKEFKAAKADAKHAAELAPQWGKPHLRLAEIYFETYKPEKAVTRLEIALGYATAAGDTAVIKEVTAKMATYRLERDKAVRRESENLAYGPMHETQGALLAAAQARQGLHETQNPMDLVNAITTMDLSGTGMETKKHVLLGQRATAEGRFSDAARDFLAAAVAGDPEGMYNYSISLLNGRGTRKNIPEAVRWLEKAASMPITDSPEGKYLNVGIGEAMASLGNLYSGGIHFHEDESRAREYWERSAELDVNSGLNNFGLCLMNGSHGAKQELPRAREMFRRSAECLHNEAMSNLAALHVSLQDFETAARWADAAAKHGFPAAATQAMKYREQAKKLASLPKRAQNELAGMKKMLTDLVSKQPSFKRENRTPTLEELRAIGTPYGNRLLQAKEMIGEAMTAMRSLDPATMTKAVDLAVQARRIDDSELVLSAEETKGSIVLGMMLHEMGIPDNADLAMLTKPTDPSSAIPFWSGLQRKFPVDLNITKRAACMYMFQAYTGADVNRGIQLFQHAFTLLPNPHDDSDPHTLDLLYLTGVGYYQIDDLKRAEGLLLRFLKHAPTDGHRKVAEANYILGLISGMKNREAPHKAQRMWTKYLQEGDTLLQRIPAFLRPAAEESPNRKQLVRLLSLVDAVSKKKKKKDAAPLSVASSLSRRRGGELIDGPRRLEELRSDFPTLQPKWRATIATMSSIMSSQESIFTSTTPARKPSRVDRHHTYSSATIDELFSALEDGVYTGRQIRCIVVSFSTFTGSSFQFVVEDSQREPARIGVYNASTSLISQLIPGREFVLLDPYVRLAQDGSLMLRVDNPLETIEVKTLYVICWVCSIEQMPNEQLKHCVKCYTATYCSKKCQTHDWRVNSHRFLCSKMA